MGELEDIYAKAIKHETAVPGATIPRSFDGPSQSANDISDADPGNSLDVKLVAAIYFHGDEEAARKAILGRRAGESSTNAQPTVMKQDS